MTAVSSPRKQVNSGLSVLRPQRAGVVYALVVVVVVFQVLSLSKGLPGFLSVTNVRNIIDQSALDGVLVISMTVLLITGNFDLSVGATAGLAGAAGLTVANSHGILLGTLTALGIGLGVGIVNGVLVQIVGVNAFIVTLGMLTALQGLLLIVTSTNTVLAKSGQFSSIGTVLRAFSPPVMIAVGVVMVLYAAARAMGKTGPRRAEPRTSGPRLDGNSVSAGVVGLVIIVGIAVFPALTTETTESWIMLVYMVLATLVLRFTIAGRRIYAVGGNTEAARLSGINVGRYKIGAFVLTSVSAGLVGLMYAGKFGAVEPTALVNEELPVLAAAILGGTSLFGGSGYVLKSVVGSLILASLTEGFNVLNLGANYQYLVQGIVIIAAAAVYTVAGRRRRATVTSGGQRPAAPGADPQDKSTQDSSSVPVEREPKGAAMRGLTSEAGLCRARRKRIAHRAPGGERGKRRKMSAAERPLVVLGRAFDGFTRALTRQLSEIGANARFELPEILDLQERVVAGDDALSGRADLVLVVTDWLPALIESGKILPLDPFFAAEPPEGWPDAWHPALRQLQRGPDGRTYGVAYHAGPQMTLYRGDRYEDPDERKGFMARFGYPLAAPDTWAQFRDQAQWFTRHDQGQYGTVIAGYPDEHNTVYDFLTQLWSRGGELTASSGKLCLNTPQALSAARFLHELWHADRVVDPASAEWDSVASGVHFAAGEAALMVNWSGFAAMSAPAESPTHGQVRCAPVPRFDGPGGRRVALNSYWVLAVATGSSRPEEAYRLLRALTTPRMDRITAQSGAVATRRDSWADPEVASSAPYYRQFEQAHGDTRALPRDPRWPQISEVINRLVGQIVSGAATPEDLLAAAHGELTALD